MTSAERRRWVVDASLALLEGIPACELLAPELALAEQRSAVLLTQDQRRLRKLARVPEAFGLAMPLGPLGGRRG